MSILGGSRLPNAPKGGGRSRCASDGSAAEEMATAACRRKRKVKTTDSATVEHETRRSLRELVLPAFARSPVVMVERRASQPFLAADASEPRREGEGGWHRSSDGGLDERSAVPMTPRLDRSTVTLSESKISSMVPDVATNVVGAMLLPLLSVNSAVLPVGGAS